MADLSALRQIRSFHAGYETAFTGLRANVGSAWETVWSGTATDYPWATAPRELSVVSTAAQNSAGGTGAVSVEMMVTGPNLGLHRVQVATAGLTPVIVPGGPYLDVLNFEVLQAGSFGSVEAGELNLMGDGVELASIEAGANQAFNGLLVVPRGWAIMPKAWRATVRLNTGNALAQFRLMQRYPGGVWLENDYAETDTVGGRGGDIAASPIARAGTQIQIQARADSGTISALASLVVITSPGRLVGEITL